MTKVPSTCMLGLLGAVVGYGSEISGTGGPVMLIPLLLALRIPVAPAIAASLLSCRSRQPLPAFMRSPGA